MFHFQCVCFIQQKKNLQEENMISKYSVKRPYTVLVAVVLVIVLGAVSLSKMTTDLLPDMSFQYALVVTTDMGASPEQVESDVTAPIESAMATTSNIKNISSVSYNSYSVVTLEYEQNANMDSVVIEIQQSLDQVSGQWDDSIGTPMIMKVNPDMMPVLAAAVDKDGMDANALSDYVKNDLAPALESLEGVASVTTTGQLEESVDVTLDQDKIDALNKKIQKKIDEQFEKSQKKIDAGKKKVESGKSSISQGSEQLNSAINQTMNQQKKLYKTEQDLKKQLAELKKQKASLEQIQTGIQTFMKSDAYTGIVTVLKDNPQLAESSEMQAQIKQVNAVVKKQFSALSSLGITVNTYEDLPAASAEVGKLLTKVNTGMKTIERAQQKVEQEYEDKVLKAQLLGELCDEDSSLLENLYYKEVLLLIKMTLSQLPDRRRQVFEMSRFEGLSHKEIADKLQIPLRTVEDHIYKTLTELRKMLMFVILFRIFP